MLIMIEQDYIMRLITDILRTILKLVFHIDAFKTEIDDIYDQEAKEGYDRLLCLIDEGKINEAENILLDNLDGTDMNQFEMALMFYSYLNDKDDDFLEKNNYTRNEIMEGIRYVTKKYGYEGLASLFPGYDQ
jgi:hypothetical protein